MKKNLLLKKNRMLKRIPADLYWNLIKFIKKVYLSDYDLKIFMARKFSNLFLAMLPFVEEEDGGNALLRYEKEFANKEKPMIISNIALPALKEDISTGKYKKILLVDDIIIHGRSLDTVFRLLKKWFEEQEIQDYKIDVCAYAESKDGLLKNKESLDYRKVEKIYAGSERRALSDRIVEILYLLGQPYTSYVPNMRIDKGSELGKHIQDLLLTGNSGLQKQKSTELGRYQIDTYIYVSGDTEPILNFSVRLYECIGLGQYIFVPMAMLKPIDDKVLADYLRVLSGLAAGNYEGYASNGKEEMGYRLAVYLISALYGWRYIRNNLGFTSNIPSYDQEEEKKNFAQIILKEGEQNKLERKGLDALWQGICNSYKPVEDFDDISSGEEDIRELDGIFDEVFKEINDPEQIYNLFGKFLYRNGVLDEARCTACRQEEDKKLIGYPMAEIAKKMERQPLEKWVSGVLDSIDYGKGSIVAKTTKLGDKTVCFSVLHAGELNYKYYVNQYFPFLYGLGYIENQTKRGKCTPEKCNEVKNLFLEKYLEYWKQRGNFWAQSDIREMEKMSVSDEYGGVINNMALVFFGDEDFRESIRISKEVMGTNEAADGLSTSM